MRKMTNEFSPEMRDRAVRRVLDSSGHTLRWPIKRSQQILCVWALWARLPATTPMTEREIGDRLTTLDSFGDAAILRRMPVDPGLFRRDCDGSN